MQRKRQFNVYLQKIYAMILVINPINGDFKAYPTLKFACKMEKWMKYQYLLRYKKLSNKRAIYKRMWIYRVNHSHL